MSLRLAQLQELWRPPATGPLALDQAELTLAPQAICTDSRQLRGGDLFLPLIGERFDGHGFLAGALEAGAAALLAQAGHLAPASQASVLAAAAAAHIPL